MDMPDAFDATGVFPALRARCARAWHAHDAAFLSGGSSSGVQAMMLAALAPGQEVTLGRDLHLSAVWGLIASGAVPRFLPTEWDAETGLARPPRLEGVAGPLFAVRPNYVGWCCAVPERTDLTLVDEAWGGHLGFSSRYPQSAMQRGADLATSSVHKMLSGLSGTALLLRQGQAVDPARWFHAAMMVSTTSPYYGAWLSLEGAVEQMIRQGAELWDRVWEGAAGLREALRGLPGIRLVEAGGLESDPTRVLFALEGWSGHAVEAALLRRGIAVEMATAGHVLLVVGLGHRPSHVQRLTTALARLTRSPQGPGTGVHWSVPSLSMPPREAWFAPRRSCPWDAASGRVAAEPVSIYPPGIPLLIPGERVDGGVVDALRQAQEQGARLLGLADPTGQTLQTVA
jgi:lysine decarboxylase